MNNDNINDFLPSLLRPRTIRLTEHSGNFSPTQNSITSQRSLSLKRNTSTIIIQSSLKSHNPLGLKRKSNCSSLHTLTKNSTVHQNPSLGKRSSRDSFTRICNDVNPQLAENHRNVSDNDSLRFSICEDLNNVDCRDKENLECTQNINIIPEQLATEHKAAESISLRFSDITVRQNDFRTQCSLSSFDTLDLKDTDKHKDVNINGRIPSVSSVKEYRAPSKNSKDRTVIICEEQPVISISFAVNDCDKVAISSNKSNIKKVSVENGKGQLNVDCKLVEGSQFSEVTDTEESLDMNELSNDKKSPQKRKNAAINFEIKKQKLSTGEQSTDKVLILKTNAIEKLTHVIVQPPNYKLVKRKILDKSKVGIGKQLPILRPENNEISVAGCHLKQKSIHSYFRSKNVLKTHPSVKSSVGLISSHDLNICDGKELVRDDAQEMNKNSGVIDFKHDGRSFYKPNRNESSKTTRHMQQSPSPKASLKTSISDVPRNILQMSKKDSAGLLSPRRPVESIQFNLPLRSKSNKNSIVARNNIPHYKIVAGTHFAVDAFSYGDIPNVKHYFLTHFHSDHYSGLKKSFNKLLLCSKITADLCTSRLGVNSKYIQVINVDETIRIEGVEVTVVDANHCPGAVMLVFTLPNGKSLLHTGDCRASPTMESAPVFWNKDMHTIYLDTTYCNPRYDFPTQDQSLEMAIYILRQKKMALEKIGKQFSSVLIVCGTYTIGKEKFFLGMARRVGCSVWACPEKDRVLQAVEGHSFSHSTPQACQLHVVPMRDLTHEKLRSYMDSMPGTFNEVVAFKPSGWENGKNSAVEKDSVTIHGIPYSEHSSFSELIRFVKFLKPKQVIPTVDISGGIKAVQKYFPCPKDLPLLERLQVKNETKTEYN
ncbi:jg10936 [Pararge aegeria aegeria]|uniref:Jg10936 protein n=2 Tax=Pararge aegeria TaxID=116150 RepID=A0A8S4SG92_9NEOP|nr:jg10936 [Pararge aegeria aegeria]